MGTIQAPCCMTTHLMQWLADGAPAPPGSEPTEHHLFFAHEAELFGDILSAKAVGVIVHKSDKSIRDAANFTIQRASTKYNEEFDTNSLCNRTHPLLLDSDGTVLRLSKVIEPELGEEVFCFAIISSPRVRRPGRPATRAGDKEWQFRRAFTVDKHEHFRVPSWVRRD